MANTVIQIKRSNATAVPTDGSLAAAEPAYSYLSDKLFIGNPSGTGVIEIGGRYYSNLTVQAYNQANTARDHANAAFNKANTSDSATIGAAFDKANSANIVASQAFDKANSANYFAFLVNANSAAAFDKANSANIVASGAFDKANSSNITASQAFDKANSANIIASGAFDKANSSNIVASQAFDKSNSANIIASQAFDKANAANVLAYNTGIGANGYTDAANTFLLSVIAGANAAVGAGANAYSDATFVKLISTSQTITGNLAITGSLIVSGNAFSIDTETLRVSDPLIYLAGNNYVSDIVDIGFVANYNNGSANVHTGFFRDATTKQYYLFEGYDKEPEPNHINTTGNNFTISTLNANLVTSNLNLGGINAISWITSAFDKANSANIVASQAFDKANAANVLAYDTGIGANGYAAAVGVAANSYAAAVGVAANSYADLVGQAANTNAANASYLSTGTVPSARISGAYTGITAVGTLSIGTWNADTITVPYGGTGATTFTANGILFGNTTGALKVTAAGTEGQVLQAAAGGTPQFGMLDGGTF